MSNNFQVPSFNHPEVAVLYEHDLSIPKEKIATILELPRATLIEDLKTVLADCIERHSFLNAKMSEEGVWLEMPTHVSWLLIELDAVEALPNVLNLLQQNEDFGNVWFGDAVTEDYWQILYALGGNNLEELKTFLLKPGEWTHRAVASSAVEQIAFHQPERRAEVLEWYRSILETFLDTKEGDPSNLEVITSMVRGLIALEAKEFLPLIKKLDDKGLLDRLFIGSYKDIKQDMDNPYRSYKRDFFSSIYDRYQDVMTTWHGYRSKYDKTYKSKGSGKKNNVEAILSDLLSSSLLDGDGGDFEQREKVVKVGRNEPCPCGSGKKYKKCCLRK